MREVYYRTGLGIESDGNIINSESGIAGEEEGDVVCFQVKICAGEVSYNTTLSWGAKEKNSCVDKGADNEKDDKNGPPVGIEVFDRSLDFLPPHTSSFF